MKKPTKRDLIVALRGLTIAVLASNSELRVERERPLSLEAANAVLNQFRKSHKDVFRNIT